MCDPFRVETFSNVLPGAARRALTRPRLPPAIMFIPSGDELYVALAAFTSIQRESLRRDQQLCIENRRAGRAADGVVAERDEAEVHDAVAHQAADGRRHATFCVAVQARLRAVALSAHNERARGRCV